MPSPVRSRSPAVCEVGNVVAPVDVEAEHVAVSVLLCVASAPGKLRIAFGVKNPLALTTPVPRNTACWFATRSAMPSPLTSAMPHTSAWWVASLDAHWATPHGSVAHTLTAGENGDGIAD